MELHHSFEESVGKFFDFDGYFDEDAFRVWLTAELKEFERIVGGGKVSKSEESKKEE